MRATFALFVLLAGSGSAAGTQSPPAERSTGQVESAVEPALPAAGVALEIGADEKPVLRDGKATPTEYRLFTFRPPPGRMFELRLFAPGATEGAVSMQVFRGDAKSPEPGAALADRTQMWMSSASGETLRILVLGHRPGETPFQLGAKLHPKSSDE